MQLETGVRIASFEVHARIGSGGMGTVYQAHDPRLGRKVAIKVMNDRLENRDDCLQRFAREARSASALNHPNIITIYEVGEFDGAPFIAMELVEGRQLRDLLAHGALPVRKIVNIAAQIADGLAAAHERGIVHRDMKPENVMITGDGLAKILDFGLARLSPATDPDEDTAELFASERNRLIGTTAYMSPEQASGEAIDFRSDQFSFGSVLFEMATGLRAFARGSTAATLEAIVNEDPVAVQRLNPNIPAPLCWIIERCLAKDPAERYASTRDLAHEIRSLREHLGDSTSVDVPQVTDPRRRRRIVILSAAAGLAVVLLALTLAFIHDRSLSRPALAADHLSIAVLPFADLRAGPEGQVWARGFADAVSARLSRFPSIQVIPPTSTAPLVASGADEKRIGQEFAASFLLNGTVQGSGDTLKVTYSLRDWSRGRKVDSETVSGSVDNIWALRDQVSDRVARRLGISDTVAPTQQSELRTPEQQDLYLRALGNLQNVEDNKAIGAAIDNLRELLENAYGSPLVHAALGRAYLQKYNLTMDRSWSDKAIVAADRARTLAPESPDVLLTLASVQSVTGRYPEAIETYKHALALQPNSPEGLISLAAVYRASKQAEDAERTFRRGIALRPSLWTGYNELGVLYLANARYDDAAREFRRAIDANPQTHGPHANLGIIYLRKEQLTEAAAEFRKAIAIREQSAGYGNLAYCYYYLGDYEKSAEAYRKAASLKPKLATHWANLADACRWASSCKGEVAIANAKAIQLLNEELSVNPKNARAHATLGICLAKIGQSNAAHEHIREALSLDPTNPDRMFNAARVENLTGNTTAAVAWLRRAVDAGRSQLEIRRDPEFRALRETPAFREAFMTNTKT